MSAWPASDPAVAREAAAAAQDDAWRAERLRRITEISADRALTAGARHALIELLFDPVEDAVIVRDDEHLPWSRRLAGRLGLMPHGLRKVLAELEAASLVRREGRVVEFRPDGWAERRRCGTDAPRFANREGLGPDEAHACRLERLRDFAVGDGLFATALATHRAIGLALCYDERRPKPEVVPEPPSEPPPPEPPPRNGCAAVLPIIRGLIAADPEAGRFMLETLAEIRAEEAASGAGPPSAVPDKQRSGCAPTSAG